MGKKVRSGHGDGGRDEGRHGKGGCGVGGRGGYGFGSGRLWLRSLVHGNELDQLIVWE